MIPPTCLPVPSSVASEGAQNADLGTQHPFGAELRRTGHIRKENMTHGQVGKVETNEQAPPNLQTRTSK